MLVLGSLFYYLPKTISMFHWVGSGVIGGYFYLLAPVNFLILGFAIISIYSFKSKFNSQYVNGLLISNIAGFILMVLWFPFIFSS